MRFVVNDSANVMKRPRFETPSQIVSDRMRRVKRSGTKLEKAMERLLRQNKIRYQRQPPLPGRPDFRVRGTSVLIFCDSSFWHGRREKELSGEAFKKNQEFWKTKLSGNRTRDARTNRRLRRDGWHVLRFWDTDILKSPEKVVRRLRKELGKSDE